MKVLILANNDVGLYKFRKELIEELIKDNEVYISLPYGDFIKPFKDIGCNLIDTYVDRRGINPKTDLMLLFSYVEIVKRIKPELVITYTIKPNIYGGFVSRLFKIPYAVNITGLGTAFQNRGLLRSLVTNMYKISIKSAKMVFFENSENMQIFIDKNIVKQDKTCLLNGAGVNLDYYSYLEYPSDTDTTRFLFIGRVMKEKGVDELFYAMKRLHDDGENCILDVLGGFEEDYKDVLERYEKEGWLKYHGFKDDVRPFIKKCACFVLPSWHEGMANTNLECAASGRPIITSNIAGCKEAVIDGVTGFLCEKQNDYDLYKTMSCFLGLSIEQRERMGREGRKHMEMFFDKRKVVNQTMMYFTN